MTAGWIWDEARGEGITNGTSGDVQEGRGKGGLGLLRKKLRGGEPKGGRGRGGWLEGMTRSSRRRRARGAQEGGARGKGPGAWRENSGSGSRDVSKEVSKSVPSVRNAEVPLFKPPGGPESSDGLLKAARKNLSVLKIILIIPCLVPLYCSPG